MNKETAHLYLPLVQALADGELQERSLDGGWEDCGDSCDFADDPKWYRRKPKSKKEWVRVGLWTSGIGDRCHANSEAEEKSLEKRTYFGGWLTDRIEYEVQE